MLLAKQWRLELFLLLSFLAHEEPSTGYQVLSSGYCPCKISNCKRGRALDPVLGESKLDKWVKERIGSPSCICERDAVTKVSGE